MQQQFGGAERVGYHNGYRSSYTAPGNFGHNGRVRPCRKSQPAKLARDNQTEEAFFFQEDYTWSAWINTTSDGTSRWVVDDQTRYKKVIMITEFTPTGGVSVTDTTVTFKFGM